MFKIFTVFSLLALLAEGGGSQSSSPWPVLIAFAIVFALLTGGLFWLRRRYRSLRKVVSLRFGKRENTFPALSDEVWKKIVSGEMARKLIRKEDRK